MDGSSNCSTIHFFSTIGRHASAPPAFQGSAFAPASSLRCGGRLRRPSNRAYVASEKSLLGFFRGSEICFANLRAAKPRLHALFVYWQERKKHACKKIPPWLDIPWQETNPFPALAAQRQAARRREPTQKKSFVFKQETKNLSLNLPKKSFTKKIICQKRGS